MNKIVSQGLSKGAKVMLASVILAVVWLFCATIAKDRGYALNWLGVIVFLYSVYTWSVVSKEGVMSPYLIFLSFFFLFNFGQCAMWAFGIHLPTEIGKGWFFGFSVSDDLLERVKLYTCICMLVFHCGALCGYKPRPKNKKASSISPDITRRAMYLIGVIFSIITIPAMLYHQGNNMLLSWRFGYASLYYSDFATQGGIFYILSIFFFPALVCLLIGSNFSKHARWIVLITFSAYLMLGMLSGDRSSWLISLVVFIWFVNRHYKPLDMKKLIILGIISIYLLSVVTSARNVGINDLKLADFADVFTISGSPIVATIFSMGGSMNIITLFLLKGNWMWLYGNTYITAILGAVSTRFASLFGVKFVLVADWFSKDYLNLSYGAGFSMFGEAYLNGGKIGALFYLFIQGAIIASFLYSNSDITIKDAPLKVFINATALNTLIGLSRNDSYLFVKELFYGTILMAVCIYVLSIILNRKSLSTVSVTQYIKKKQN